MTSTADRYREAGMHPPGGEYYIPNAGHRSTELLREAATITDARRRTCRARPIPLASPDLADSANPPENPAATSGSVSVPLDPPDPDRTEETS